jgi:hypothetical protein
MSRLGAGRNEPVEDAANLPRGACLSRSAAMKTHRSMMNAQARGLREQASCVIQDK